MTATAPTGSDAMRAALAALAEPPAGGGQPFVSDLTVGELVLLDEVGYQPVDLVFGAGAASWSFQSVAVPNGSDAWAWALTSAIASARSEVERELHGCRAEGVVAVKLEMHRHPGNVLLCTMVGTAVRRSAASGAHRGSRSAGSPFTTTLSAGDFHLLVRAGYAPVGMVAGAAVAGFPGRSMTQGLGLAKGNAELGDQTAALYAAREQAMSRLEAEARGLGGDGVVAVTFQERPFSSVLVHAVELLVVGTAVRRGPDGHRSLDPHLQLSLDDPPSQMFQHG